MKENKFVILFTLPIYLLSCSPVNKTLLIDTYRINQIHFGDTVFMIKPEAIVRKHFGESPQDFNIDSVESIQAASDLMQGIKTYGEKKIRLLEVQNDKSKWKEFRHRIEPVFVANSNLVDVNHIISDALNSSEVSREKIKIVIIPYLEWDYDYWDFYSDMRHKYTSFAYGSRSRSSSFTKTTTIFTLHFIVVDLWEGKILIYRFVNASGAGNKKPEFKNMKFYIQGAMRPFLKRIKKRGNNNK